MVDANGMDGNFYGNLICTSPDAPLNIEKRKKTKMEHL